MLIFFVYYGLPAVGLHLQSFSAAVLALTLFKTAQVVEYLRGAVGSIPQGQTEAAMAIGLTFRQRLPYVIFPQALRRFLPPWINGVTDAVKGSALVSLLGVTDLMQAINQVIGRTYEAMPLYILGALDLLRHQLRALARQPAAGAALRLHPGIASMSAAANPALLDVRDVSKAFGTVAGAARRQPRGRSAARW